MFPCRVTLGTAQSSSCSRFSLTCRHELLHLDPPSPESRASNKQPRPCVQLLRALGQGKAEFWGCSVAGAATASSTPLPCARALKFHCFHMALLASCVRDVPHCNECSFTFWLWHVMRDLGCRGPSWPKALLIISSPSHTCFSFLFFFKQTEKLDRC